MPDLKISQMTVASTLDGTEVVPLVQTGTNVQTTTAEFVSEVLDVNPVLTTQGGTGLTSYTLGDVIYASATNTLAKLAGNTTTTNKFLRQVGTGSVSAAPIWDIIDTSDINTQYGSFFYGAETTLTSGFNSNVTTPIPVADTTNFASSGWILIDQEIIAYVGKTSTTLGSTSVTRGVAGTQASTQSNGAKVNSAQVASANTANAVLINNTDQSNGVSVASNSQITFANAGIYNVQFSIQLLNGSSSIDNAIVWFKKQGSDISYSASVVSVPSKHGSGVGASIITVNIFVSVTAGQYIEIYWSNELGNASIVTYPSSASSPAHPTSPAVIVTANQVS